MANIHSDAVPEALQKHFAVHGARMMEKETYRGQDIFYADGGPHKDAKADMLESEEDKWMLDGYYVTAFGIKRGQAVVGFPLYFKLNHDTHLKKDDRVKARIGSAKHAAHSAIDAMLNVGLLEEYSGSILLPAGAA